MDSQVCTYESFGQSCGNLARLLTVGWRGGRSLRVAAANPAGAGSLRHVPPF